jgi:hypothetical protein
MSVYSKTTRRYIPEGCYLCGHSCPVTSLMCLLDLSVVYVVGSLFSFDLPFLVLPWRTSWKLSIIFVVIKIKTGICLCPQVKLNSIRLMMSLLSGDSNLLYRLGFTLYLRMETDSSLRNRVLQNEIRKKGPSYKGACNKRVSVPILATLRSEHRLPRVVLNPLLPTNIS